MNDVAGIRVICPFISDIYAVSDMLRKQDDVHLIALKDYIQNPKPNGYRSLHLIIEIPVFFSTGKENIRVEIQIRTVAMDFTSHAYYFNFEDGYLTFYATSKNGTKLYNIEGPWKCGKNVAYYSSASAMAQGQAAEATVNTVELNFAKDSGGNRFYISNLDTSYRFAMIQTNYGKYYFQNENGKWLMVHF